MQYQAVMLSCLPATVPREQVGLSMLPLEQALLVPATCELDLARLVAWAPTVAL